MSTTLNQREPAATKVFSEAAVVGAGYMGGGIAQVMAMAGVRVTLADQSPEAAMHARERLLTEVQGQEQRQLVPSGTTERVAEHIVAADSIEAAVGQAKYVTEAVFEDPAVKADALERISNSADDAVVIGSNTSAIPIEQLAKSVRHPERFLGVHWMNPAPFIPGIELIPTERTDAEVLTSVHAFLTGLGKRPTRVSDAPGFVANRLQFALYREALLMLEEGLATPAEIDEVVSNTFGFRLAVFGPFTIGDMAGLDVYDSSYATLSTAYGSRFASPDRLRHMIDQGMLGLKSQRGMYEIPAETAAELIQYRERAYARLAALKEELGRSPELSENEADRSGS